MLNVLETLHGTVARLENPDEEFGFRDWRTCNCGHIYAATNGQTSSREWYVFEPTGRYARVIMATARALGWAAEAGDVAAHAASFVSSATSRLARDGGNVSGHVKVTREHAIAVVNQAIAVIEAEQERDRQAVLAQAAAVVDAVDVEAVTA